MDLITQGIFGAAVGTAVAGRELGWKAPVLGFVGGLIPDSDVLWSQGPGVEHWALHRHVTHSLWFGPVLGSALTALMIWVCALRQRSMSAALRWAWWRLWVLVLFTHPLLDTFTQYGTQLLAPFTDLRFAIPAVPIIDLKYSLTLLGFLIAALFVGLKPARAGDTSPRGVNLMWWGLAITTGYLFLGAAQNPLARHLAQGYLQSQGIEFRQVHAYTTMFTPWLRRVVVELPPGRDGSQTWMVGFLSTLSPKAPEFTQIHETPELVAARHAALRSADGQRFARFAVGPIWALWADSSSAAVEQGHAVEPEHVAGQGRAPEQRRVVVRLADGRFGLPGPSVIGLWGLQWSLDSSDQPSGTPVRFRTPMEPDAMALRQFFLAKIGRAQAGYGY